MKLKVLILGWLWYVCFIAHAQTVNDISKVVLGVRFLDDSSAETMSSKTLLENKLVMFATQAGCSSFGSNTFFVSPNVVINSVDVAEGGMKNVYVVQGDLYLTIRDASNGTVYSSASFPFKGSATKKDVAIKNAIQNINYNKVQGLFSEAKAKILSYYEQQRDAIFARAETCARNGKFDEAITCLMMIPEELTDLYVEALGKAQVIYNMRDNAIRKQMIAERHNSNESVLTEANSLLAMHKPQEALRLLWRYRSEGNEAQDEKYAALIKKAESLVSASERETLRKEERAYQDNKEREARAWQEYTKVAEHRRDMNRREMDLKDKIVDAAERVAHDKISVEKQAIAASERVAHDKISADRQAIAASERVAHHRANVDAQKVNALKTVACEYIRNNPNTDYIRVKF